MFSTCMYVDWQRHNSISSGYNNLPQSFLNPRTLLELLVKMYLKKVSSRRHALQESISRIASRKKPCSHWSETLDKKDCFVGQEQWAWRFAQAVQKLFAGVLCWTGTVGGDVSCHYILEWLDFFPWLFTEVWRKPFLPPVPDKQNQTFPHTNNSKPSSPTVALFRLTRTNLLAKGSWHVSKASWGREFLTYNSYHASRRDLQLKKHHRSISYTEEKHCIPVHQLTWM